ncbi:hypothetical protein KSS87_003602, partial [Heliosperma pusillum]
MGAPKQKWTAEEEAALKAGVHKHGAGKWQTILRDPAFEDVLRSRSNVDLKDKWRNINVTLSGLGSREKARLALKRNPHVPKLGDKVIVADTAKVDEKVADTAKVDEKVAEARPVLPSDPAQVADSKKSYTRLDTVILEAITTLKEPKGSDKNAIAMYIEVKHKYRISTSVPASEPSVKSPPSDSKLMDRPRTQRKELKLCTRPEVVADLEKMKCMSAQEAAAAAAQAVA